MARHDRAYLREQRSRIIAKRVGFLRRTRYDYILEFKHHNQFATKHPLDCGRSNCGVCTLYDPSRRAREKREWKNTEATAW